ncbi:MAG: LysE family transporter [Promethearchaeota archaeon]
MNLWELFIVTFILGLGGAISPGALLTFTIYKGIEAGPRAYLTGLFISLGHVILEVLMIFLLLLGVNVILANPQIMMIIGVLGGIVLIYFGSRIVIDWRMKKIDMSFLENQTNLNNNDNQKSQEITSQNSKKIHLSRNPMTGSMLFLMSNPYWWLWWATVGIGIILNNNVSFSVPLSIIVFIIGKELGAVLWYTFVATILGLFRKKMTKNIYLVILLLCASFMIGYGIYLPISTLFQ